MAELTMGPRQAGFIISEGNGYISREQVVLKNAAGALKPGTVLGQVTADSEYVQLTQDAVDGSEVAAGILYRDEDATDAAQQILIIARDAEVDAIQLIWPADIDAGEKTTAISQLEAAGIIVR